MYFLFVCQLKNTANLQRNFKNYLISAKNTKTTFGMQNTKYLLKFVFKVKNI